MNDEVKCYCQHCNEKLEPTHKGPCPKCGKTGKNYKAYSHVVIGVSTDVSAKHKQEPSSKSIAILGIFITIFLAIICPAILMVPPFNICVNFGILVGFLLVVALVVWWTKYHIWTFVRRLETKIGGEKKIY